MIYNLHQSYCQKMKKNIFLTLTLTFFIACLFSCKTKSNDIIEEEETVTNSLDSVVNHHLTADTTKKTHEIQEQKENLAKIEKKYGEQWGFCECVVANDSIDKAVKNIVDFETPQAEKLLERFEYVSTKCQAFLGMDASRTPEERQKHEKKVKKCLKDAKQ